LRWKLKTNVVTGFETDASTHLLKCSRIFNYQPIMVWWRSPGQANRWLSQGWKRAFLGSLGRLKLKNGPFMDCCVHKLKYSFDTNCRFFLRILLNKKQILEVSDTIHFIPVKEIRFFISTVQNSFVGFEKMYFYKTHCFEWMWKWPVLASKNCSETVKMWKKLEKLFSYMWT
jgi:hypothetical protein